MARTTSKAGRRRGTGAKQPKAKARARARSGPSKGATRKRAPARSERKTSSQKGKTARRAPRGSSHARPASAAAATKASRKTGRKAAAHSVRRQDRTELGSEAHARRARPPADRPVAPPPSRPPRDRSGARAGGLREMSWSRVDTMARELASAVSRAFEPELVVGVVKGGVYAGREVAAALRTPFVPVRLHARSRDSGVQAEVGIPASAAGKRVLVVDDIAGTGATLKAAVAETLAAGATQVRTCTLVVREHGFRPDWFVLETSDLVVLPWDYEPSAGALGNPGDEYGV